MAGVRIEFNDDALQKILELSQVEEKLADQVAARANSALGEEGFLVSSETGRETAAWVDRVYAATDHAKRANAKRNILLRSLDG